MIIFILLQIRFQIWHQQRFLTAKVRNLKREQREQEFRWQLLEQDQKLLNTKLAELIFAYQQQQLQMEVILENLSKKPPTTRTELLKVLNLIGQIRAMP